MREKEEGKMFFWDSIILWSGPHLTQNTENVSNSALFISLYLEYSNFNNLVNAVNFGRYIIIQFNNHIITVSTQNNGIIEL